MADKQTWENDNGLVIRREPDGSVSFDIFDADEWNGGIEEGRIIAALIVRAVNRDHLFDEMLVALAVYANPDNWQEMTGEFLVYEPDDDDRPVFDAGQIARAVLAKVEAPHA